MKLYIFHHYHSDARLQMFGQGSGPQYNCTADGNLADCTILPTLHTCNHTGINCLSNQELGNSSTSALGAITGVLVVALVAVVTAWIISFVYAKRFVLISINGTVRS